LEIAEAPDAIESVTNDQQRPMVANQLKRTGDRTGFTTRGRTGHGQGSWRLVAF
jgi:hypothetical protein